MHNGHVDRILAQAGGGIGQLNYSTMNPPSAVEYCDIYLPRDTTLSLVTQGESERTFIPQTAVNEWDEWTVCMGGLEGHPKHPARELSD